MGSRFANIIRRHVAPIALIAVIWVLFVVITNPSGNFPLNDDWNYGRTVKSLLEEHKLIVTQWSLAASLTHLLVGYLACLPWGFSFEALRISTIIFGFIGAVGIYFLGARVTQNRALTVFLALTVCSNPLFFNLSLTFMTDVPFLALAAMALLLLGSLFEPKQATIWRVLAASALVTAVCLLRQTGLVIPIAFAIARWRMPKSSSAASSSRPMPDIVVALVPIMVSTLCVVSFQAWLGKEVGTLYCYRVEQAYLQQRIAKGAAFLMADTTQNLIKAFIYLGLFTLPVMPLVFPRFIAALDKSQRFLAFGLVVEIAVLFALGLAFTGSAMPLADNLFFNLGLGPLLVGLESTTPAWPAAPKLAMQVLGWLGCAGAGFLISILGIVLIRKSKHQSLLANSQAGNLISLCLLILAFYLAIICFRGFFDRYLLFPLLLLVPVLAASTDFLRMPDSIANKSGNSSFTGNTAPVQSNIIFSKVAWSTAIIILLPLAGFAVGGTHDYLAWNRARWQAAHELTAVQAISPLDVDGGLEFNGWYGYDPRYRNSGIVFDTSMRHNDAYGITLSPVRGYEIIRRFPFQRWIPTGAGEILVVKKLGDA